MIIKNGKKIKQKGLERANTDIIQIQLETLKMGEIIICNRIKENGIM